MTLTTQIFEVVLVCIVVTFAGAPVSIWLAKRVKLIDFPKSAPHKHHLKPTPMAGGILLVFTFFVVGSIFRVWKIPEVLIIFIAGLIVFLFGIWDDIQNISPLKKLLGQIVAAILLVQSGISVHIFDSLVNSFDISLQTINGLNIFVTIFWVVAITNAFNFIDSMDGLAIGTGGIVVGFLMLFSIDSAQVLLAQMSAGLAAICVGVYFFNSRPALFFLGDSGAQVLGFWIAVLTLVYIPLDVHQMSSWFAPILLVGVPIFDMGLVVLSRFWRRHPVYLSARDHTYHRLRYFGFDSNRVVLIMHIATVILGCLAIISLYQKPVIANLIFGFVVICGFGIMIFLEKKFPNSESVGE